MLEFSYLPRPIKRNPPPNLPPGTSHRFRPIVQVTLIGPTGLTFVADAVIDTGSDECLVPYFVLPFIQAVPRPQAEHHVTWRGKQHPIAYADISLLLTDGTGAYRWPATVAFTPAPIKYILLGTAACLEYFDARFRGADRTVELEANWTYPGTK